MYKELKKNQQLISTHTLGKFPGRYKQSYIFNVLKSADMYCGSGSIFSEIHLEIQLSLFILVGHFTVVIL